MSQADDLDMSIDGFDPDDVLSPRHSRRRRDDYDTTPAPVRRTSTSQVATQPAPTPDKNKKGKKSNNTEPKQTVRENVSQPNDDATSGPSKWAIVRFFTDDRLRVFLGLTLLISCVFILAALVSYLKNGIYDQSIVMNSTLAEMAEKGQIKNAGGGFGAWLSHVMMSEALGIGSIVFIGYAWLVALALVGWRKCHFWSLTFKTLLLAITLSVVLGLLTYNSPTPIHWGGTHGYFVNKFLIAQASWLGALGVSAILVIAVICVYLNEIHNAWQKWREAVNRRKLQEELRRERKRKLETMADPVAEVPSEHKPDQTENESPNEESPQIENEGATSPQNTIQIDIAPAEESEKINDSFAVQSDIRKSESQLEDIPNEEDYGFTIEETDDKPVEAGTTENITIDDAQVNLEPSGESNGEESGFSIVAPEIEVADKIATHVEVPKIAVKDQGELGLFDHRAELSRFKFPDIELLAERKSGAVIDMEEQQANKDRIVKTLLDYNIPISRIEATVGPTVTLYEIVPAEGVRISQIKRLEDDIALSLSALGIRIIAPIPGKGTVGIEVPNSDPQTVSMRAVITSKKYQECKMALPMAMGATISNDIFIADMAKMPHLLVAGATGMGKSVGLNAIIASLLYKKHPSELKFVLIDPKMVEFSLYSKLERHYLAKLPDEDDAIITDPNKVILTLNSLCVEMDDRYSLLRKAGVRSLEEYNKKFTERKLLPSEGHKYLPYIVVIVDEFADLIMTAGKEVETPIARIAQKARAVGMHMIIATQRPSTNVITGIIKANFPGRIAFRVIQMVDSKTILDSPGANQLIGRGDMLFSHNGSMERVQCAFISTEEVEAITDWIDNQVGFEHAYFLPEYVPEGGDGPVAGASMERDALFDEAARFVVQRQVGSTSSLQRQFNIGYNRAGRLMDQMEAAGIIGPVNGSKPRNILVDSMSLERILSNEI